MPADHIQYPLIDQQAKQLPDPCSKDQLQAAGVIVASTNVPLGLMHQARQSTSEPALRRACPSGSPACTACSTDAVTSAPELSLNIILLSG